MITKYRLRKISSTLMLAIKAFKNPRKVLKYIVNPHLAFKILMEPFFDAKLKGVSIKYQNYQFTSSLETLAKLSNKNFSSVLIENFIEKNFIKANYSECKAKELKYLFDKFGSDKASVHKYYLIYQLILDELSISSSQGESVKIFEIGIGSNNIDVPSNMGMGGKPGASLRAFSAYLPKSTIYGADIDRRVLFKEGNIETFWVDQLSDKSLEKLFDKNNEFDLIIDDGLHTPEANLKTLFATIKVVRVGGYIVVEDIANESSVINYWNIVKTILSNSFECELVDCEAALMFIAKRKI